MVSIWTALWIARGLALAGFLDAAYLTASHFTGGALACGPGGGCDVVTTSRFATIGEVPIAAIGMGYYVAVNLLAWTPAGDWRAWTAASFLALTATATAVSAVLVAIQATVLDAWCRYCLLSAALTAALFLCAVVLSRGRTREPKATVM